MAHKDIFCNVPWFHLQLFHDGSFGVCCIQKQNVTGYQKQSTAKYNIHTHSISDWYNSTVMDQHRQGMLGDVPVDACSNCYRDESYGNESYRISNNWRSVIFTRQAFDHSFAQSPHLPRFQNQATHLMPVDFHIDMGNECNLACKFCHPTLSTQIASKDKVWGLLDKNTATRMNWMDDDATWDKFCYELLAIKNLQSVHFMGGEPTMSPRLEQFFDFFISHGRTDFAISFVTNGTLYSPELVRKMQQFRRADIDISIESILDNNYYIRQGLEKQSFLNNVTQYLQHQSDNFAICLKPVISALTAPTFPELMEYFLDNNIITESNICWDPAYLQVAVLPWAIRQTYLPKFERVLQRLQTIIGNDCIDMSQSRIYERNASNIYNELNSVYQMLQAPEPKNVHALRQELVMWLTRWDNVFDTDARDHYPEWGEFLQQYGYKISH